MPITYIPKALADTVATENVLGMRLYAEPPNSVSSPEAPSPEALMNVKMTNHWVLELGIFGGQWIRLNPSPDQNLSLQLIVRSKNLDANCDSAVHLSYLTPSLGLTIGQVIVHIVDLKYDEYKFSSSGQGWWHWLYTLMTSLHAARCVKASDAELDAALDSLLAVWASDGRPVHDGQQTGMVEGQFAVLPEGLGD